MDHQFLLVAAAALGIMIAASVFSRRTGAAATAIGHRPSAIGHRVGLPPRLMSILEGESLVNDASALVVLRTAVATVAATADFSLGRTIADFTWAVAGAIAVGWIVGQLTVMLRHRLDDPVLNTTISFAVPLQSARPPDQMEQIIALQRRDLDAMRDALLAERSIGAYSSETYRGIESMLDIEEQRFSPS